MTMQEVATMPGAVCSPLDGGVRPLVQVMGEDCGRGESMVLALMWALEGGGIEVLDVQEVRIEAPPLLEGVVWAAPKSEPLTYGPQRKGRGGKVKRW